MATPVFTPTGEIIVYLAASEESRWDPGVDYTWSFEEPVCDVNSIVVNYNFNEEHLVATVKGTGFPNGDVSGIELFLDDMPQTPKSVT